MPVKLLEALGEYRESFCRAHDRQSEYAIQQMAFAYILCALDFNVIDSIQYSSLQTIINEW